MLAIAAACASGELPASLELVISNRADAPGIDAARKLGLETAVIEHGSYTSREAFDAAMTKRLETVNPDWIALAGFMRILGEDFVNRWAGRIVNIHPSLLPLYPGLNTHARAIAAGDSEAGASVHIVTPELDAGSVLRQVRVPIMSNDTAQTLAQRVIKQEHQLYIEALKQCLQRKD